MKTTILFVTSVLFCLGLGFYMFFVTIVGNASAIRFRTRQKMLAAFVVFLVLSVVLAFYKIFLA